MKKFKVCIFKMLICINIFLILGIICKSSLEYKNVIYNYMYGNNYYFSKINNFYEKYLGGIFPMNSFSSNNSKYVFSEKLIYNKKSNYHEGVKLEVGYNYIVPVIDDGVVVYVGEKEKYGKVIIVENDYGINIWYGNLVDYNVKLYDRVKVGGYLGEVNNNILYLVYSKGNEYLDYNKYLL